MSNAPTSSLRVTRRHRPTRRRIGLLAEGGGLGGLTPATAGTGGGTPHFGLLEPDDHKGTLVSGSITTAIHAAVLLFFIILGWNAAPVQELIEVKIIRELPGADEKPAPARKIIKPRKLRAPIQPAAQRVQAQAVEQPRVVQMTAEQLRMAQLNQAAAPAEVKRRQVASRRTQVRAVDTRQVSAIDLNQFDRVEIVEGLQAPVIPDYSGPVKVNPLSAPEVVSAPDVQQVEYTSGAPYQVETDQDFGADDTVYEFETDVGVFAGGEGTGGTGTAIGTVPCLESAFVVRYLDAAKARTEKRWQIPEGTPDDSVVKLGFMLDSAGAATQVEFKGDTPAALGNSAVSALRSSSPFPPMDDNVRCLAGKKLVITFAVENQ